MATREFDRRVIMRMLNDQVGEKVHQRLGEQMIGTLVLNTPVGMPSTWVSPPPPSYQPGHARFSWQTRLNQEVTIDIPGIDPGGAATIARGVGTIGKATLNDSIVFSNNAPYIGRLNQGWSPQQAPGFVDRAIKGAISSLGRSRITI